MISLVPARARRSGARGPVGAAGRAPVATSGVALVGVAATWSVLTMVFSVMFRPADCVSAEGITGFLAGTVAQMRSVAECPTGTLGYGPHTVAVVAAASALLAAALVAQVAAGLVGYWVSRAARAMHDLVAALGRAMPRLSLRARRAISAQVRNWYTTAVVPPFPVRAQWRRGPPQTI